MKNKSWWTGLLALACAGAMVAACAGGTPSPDSPEATTQDMPDEVPATTDEPEALGNEGPPAIPHAVEGREACTSCHAVEAPAEGAKPMPPDHADYDDSACQGCHSPSM